MEHGARHNEKRPLEAFEYSILRSLMPLALSQRTLFLGVSGGLDSVAMMHIMHRLVPYLDCQMAVIHVHHGRGSATQEEFRRGSYDFVKSLCKEYQVPFHSNFQPPGTWTLIPEAPLRAEGELREIRFKVFEEAMKKAPPSGNPLLTLAHHADDLLETRMMRLIRGVGPQGVQAMVNYDGKILRPLLTLSRNSFEYAVQGLRVG
ncbi:MAG: tRNA lysidine(34) synthetase TilS [Pseudobdellovibrionaceae bacterium]|nr:MAG: tRNA lysidine(34) synthetase TilS [Pseudobdellovibrionaceae bacterium]